LICFSTVYDMEVQSLFFSKLPVDCIYKIYSYVVYSRKLPTDFKNNLKVFFFINDILDATDDHLYWVENELLWILNKRIPLDNGVSEELMNRYPKMTQTYLFCLCQRPIKQSIFKIWSMLSYEDQINYLKNEAGSDEVNTRWMI
jgi:hypothetical protein